MIDNHKKRRKNKNVLKFDFDLHKFVLIAIPKICENKENTRWMKEKLKEKMRLKEFSNY